MEAVFETDLPLPLIMRGKVRDVYELPPGPDGLERLAIVATDRISAFDVVMPTPIPGKGALLTEISRRWFAWMDESGLAGTYWRSADAAAIPGLSDDQRASLAGRVTIGLRRRVVPVECVARGYLDGSGWREYRAFGAVCGVPLPTGLRRGDRLPEPIFTPATKAERGAHDENIDFDRACAIAGGELMERLRATTLAIYGAAHERALSRGLVLADTKLEYGIAEGADPDPIVIDEALTPDCSRYWPVDGWAPGGEQPSFDKQYVREYLQSLVDRDAWDKRAPGPELPGRIVRGTLGRYREARDRLFGEVVE